MSNYSKLKELAAAIQGRGTTVEMLNRWAAFEAACKPELITGLVDENTQLHGECNDHMEVIGRLNAELSMLRYAVNPCSHKIGLSDSPGHATARCVSVEAARKLGSAMWPNTFEVFDTATGERV